MIQRGKKRSFFERLTGASEVEEFDDFDDGQTQGYQHQSDARVGRGYREERYPEREEQQRGNLLSDTQEEGQLTVDVYQTPDEIVIKSIVAGVNPNDLDISITRDIVTLKGRREDVREVTDDNYYHQELYWGSFSRTILLPAEIEVEGAQAIEKHGLLTIRLPKVDKEKQTKLKVRTA